MSTRWHFRDAKNRFSEIVDRALSHGPQTVTRHGRDVVVILAIKDYRRMKQPDGSLLACLQMPAKYAIDIEVTRSAELPREIGW